MHTVAQKAVLATIEAAIIGEPRNMQQMIGPSEIGADCEHCLTAKLAGWEQKPEAAWLPYVGTAMHAYLEAVFGPLPDFLAETRVNVGFIADQPINGTSDLFHIPSGTVVDHKLVGITTLKKAKRGPTQQYRIQAHAYGLGFWRAGHDVQNVAINYLPRNAVSLKSGVWWEEPFSPLIALEALDRATRIVETLRMFQTTEARDEYIHSLPRSADCWDCSRYPDAPKAAPTDTLDSLLGV